MRTDLKAIFAAFACVLGLCAIGATAKVKPSAAGNDAAKSSPVLWRDPTDSASRDLYYGPGGKEHAPHGAFTFEREDMAGSNPKFVVTDADGVHWTVKMGPEARPETAASRLVWAAGYFANEDYFMPVLHVEKMQRLRRGGNLVSPQNNVYNVRLKRHSKDEKNIGTWAWSKDPFTGTREWYGLRVLMAALNNWDLKDTNNAVYRTHGATPEDLYIVSDLGGSFGPTGLNWALKGNPAAYCSSKWIKSVSGQFVDFNVPSRLAMNYCLDFPEMGRRLSLLWLGHHIPREDARWLGDLLSRLSTQQIHDTFRASGYSSREVEDLSSALETRIAELKRL